MQGNGLRIATGDSPVFAGTEQILAASFWRPVGGPRRNGRRSVDRAHAQPLNKDGILDWRVGRVDLSLASDDFRVLKLDFLLAHPYVQTDPTRQFMTRPRARQMVVTMVRQSVQSPPHCAGRVGLLSTGTFTILLECEM